MKNAPKACSKIWNGLFCYRRPGNIYLKLHLNQRPGSLEITFRVAGLDEIKRWVLSFGPEAVVLEPERLKDMLRKDLSKNLAQYRFSRLSINMLHESQAS